MSQETLFFIHPIHMSLESLEPVFSLAAARQATLNVLVLSVPPVFPTLIYGSGNDSGQWAQSYAQVLKDNDDRVLEVLELGKTHSVETVVTGDTQQAGMVDRSCARQSLYTDIAVLYAGIAGGDDLTRALHGIVLGAGTPALVLSPTIRGSNLSHPSSALVAWQPTPEASRALRFARHWLDDSCALHVVMVGDNTLEEHAPALTAWLETGSREYSITQCPLGGGTVSEKLIAEAYSRKVDLMVMGAYGHSPLRETLFGGTTRHILRELDLPVLTMH